MPEKEFCRIWTCEKCGAQNNILRQAKADRMMRIMLAGDPFPAICSANKCSHKIFIRLQSTALEVWKQE